MRKTLISVGLVGLALLVLSGCMRQSAYYYIQPDDTVDGTIYIARDEAFVDASDPYRGTGAGEIAAFFAHTTITPQDFGKWKGYNVTFSDEPIATFAAVPDETWGVQITRVGTQYVIHGYEPQPSEDSVRQAIIDGDGFLRLTVAFPGSLIEQTGADQSSPFGDAPGWASWDGTTIANAPFARGNDGLLFHLIPGFEDLFLPGGDPDPMPAPTAAPAPQPVVTVFITKIARRALDKATASVTD